MTSSELAWRQPPWRPDPALERPPEASPFVPWQRDKRPAPTFSVWQVLPETTAQPHSPGGADGNPLDIAGTESVPALLSGAALDPAGATSAAEISADAEALAQRFEHLRQEGWNEGHAQGLREGQRRIDADRTRRDAGHDASKAAVAERQVALQQEILHALRELHGDAKRLHAPLARLALHLAEQLVRGELQLGGQAIARLVEHTLNALGPHPLRTAVRLHPDDLAALGPLAQNFGPHVVLEPAEHLRRGSVEAIADDTLVQDLVENRIDALALQLLGTAPATLEGQAAAA